MTLAEFTRIYPLRSKNLAWFFGAGTSVSSGMPSAGDLVWDFKRKIYCSEEGYSLSLFSNLSDPAIRNQIQSYFDSKGDYPAYNSLDEYSFYFEKAFPSAIDRSNYLMQQLKLMQNSFGHKALGILMKNDLIRLIFTTNFDKAFENAAIDQLRTLDKFLVATTENTQAALQKYHDSFRPLIVKLHGDYFSEKLKNTATELQSQDSQLRDILYHSCLSNGLAIMGYSGRDKSIMEVFEKALEQSTCFPNGIFWFCRHGAELIPQVVSFLAKAKDRGIQSEIIEIDTFDTAWADIIKGVTGLSSEDTDSLNTNYFKLANSQISNKGTKYPIIRFNAAEIVELPTSARILKCEAGNTSEIKKLIVQHNSDILAIRKKEGIVAFGADAEMDRVFVSYGPIQKDVFSIPDYLLYRDDSSIKSLLTSALLKAVVRDKPLIHIRRRSRDLLIPDPKKLNESIFNSIKKELNQIINGTIPGSGIQWIIAAEISIQSKLSGYYMLISPTIIAGKTTDSNSRFQIAAYIKEATARWYNVKYANLLNAWLDIIFDFQKEITISAFDSSSNGFNATYKLKRSSPYSKTM